MSLRESLEAALPRVIDALRSSGACVLVAPPGTGKSTHVPPALLAAGLLDAGRCVLLQPRRIAARAVARRIAFLRGSRLGDEVGYRVRFEDRTSAATRIEVVTEGLLTRRLQSDPFLEGTAVVVLDEMHERSLHGDLALAMLAEVRRDARPDLKVLVMSATLDPGPVARFLDDCPVVEVNARPHTVTVVYDKTSSAESPIDRCPAAILELLAQSPTGDVLVFLPGKGEINDVTAALAGRLPATTEVLPLHGALPPEQQDRVFSLPPVGMRRVVLATNVAETSITVEGVTAVVDTGLARTPRFDPRTGLEKLERGRISRASADQRAGRAGRTGPGTCRRLWSAQEHEALAAAEVPELRRADLCRVLLEVRGWGADPRTFRYLEAPSVEALDAAETTLLRIGGIDAHGLTELGRTLLALPLHPRLGAVVVAGHAAGVLRDAATAAALMNERDPLRSPPDMVADSDLGIRLDALDELERRRFSQDAIHALRLDPRAAREVLAARDQILQVAHARLGPETSRPSSLQAAEAALLRALLAGFPDRVAQRRAPRSARFQLAGGGGCVLDPKSVVREAPWVLAVGLDAAPFGGEHKLRLASALDPAWLQTERAIETRFDPERQAVVQFRTTRFLALTLGEFPVGQDADPEAVARTLAMAVAVDPGRAFDLQPVESLLLRLRFLAQHLPEVEAPTFESLDHPQAAPSELILALCWGKRSFADLRRMDLNGELLGRLPQSVRTALDRHAPERFALPLGRSARVVYAADAPPVLAAKIQWFFGVDRTPALADGRVRCVLHLLAPNGRPAQVTQDLASFWRGSWSLVRKELRGRYPRHAWPEDPFTAWPTDD
ncbi:MAG: ATP-dependent helicase HrpB [Bradymonadia bacterium]